MSNFYICGIQDTGREKWNDLLSISNHVSFFFTEFNGLFKRLATWFERSLNRNLILLHVALSFSTVTTALNVIND